MIRPITLTRFRGHSVDKMCWCEKYLAIVLSFADTIEIWDTRKCVVTLEGHTDDVYSLSWSGKYLASGSQDNTIKIWDLVLGDETRPDLDTIECIATLEGHTNTVRSLCWSEDGKYLASGSDDTTIKIWDIILTPYKAECIATLMGHSSIVNSLCWCGEYLASGSEDTKIKIWNLGWGDETRPDLDTNECIATLDGHTRWVSEVCWGKKYLVSASGDNTIKIWDLVWRDETRPDLDTKKCIATLKGHTDYIVSICWCGDEKYLASSSWDCSIRIWDLETMECITTFTYGHFEIESLCWYDNKLISGDDHGNIMRWNVHNLISNYKLFYNLTKLRFIYENNESNIVLHTSNDSKIEHTLEYVITKMCNDLFTDMLQLFTPSSQIHLSL